MMIYLIVAVVALWLGFTWWQRRGLPPGPFSLPILGNLLSLDPKAPHLTLTQLSEKYGPIYGIWLGSVYTVVLSEVKLIKKVLMQDSTTARAPLYLTHGIMKGYGLICAEGDLWKDQRKFIHNSLRKLGATRTSQNRDQIHQLILKHINELIMNLEQQQSQDPISALRHSLGSVVNELVFGKSWSKDDPLWIWLQSLQEEGTKLISVSGVINFLPFLRFLPNYAKIIQFITSGKEETHKHYKKIIDERRTVSNPKNILEAFLLERECRSPEDVEKYYNDQQFYHLLADCFGAGLDTTLTTLRWYLLYMAIKKDIQKLVRKELKDVLSKDELKLSDIEFLPLLEASIAETQRIRSVVPVGIPHGTTEEIIVDGFRIPKGAMIIPLQWAVHMGKAWKDPETFNPLRFIDENHKFHKPESFIPFQTGKRMCVGEDLGRMLLILFAGGILKKFRIELEGEADLEGECGITLNPKEHKLNFIQD